MKSGTEKNPNPHEVSLSKFLSSLATPVRAGYVAFKNGQIIREDTWKNWKAGLYGRAHVPR